MFNFINQVSAAIYRFFSSIHGFFSALWRRFAQPKPVRELVLAEMPSINYEGFDISMVTTLLITPIISFERENRMRDWITPLSLNDDLFLQQATQDPLSTQEHLLLTGLRTQGFFREDNTSWDRWFREEMRRQRQQSEAELAVWRRNLRRQWRTEQFAAAVTVLDEELNATKLENYPDLEVDDDFICGISQEIMTNPVYDPAFPQQKYDLLVIELWLHEHETNPYTRTSLLTENLVYDEALKLRIDRFMSETFQEAVRNNLCNSQGTPS